MSAPDFSNYRALLEKVSAKFDEIFARHKSRMNCGKGCSSCCLPDLSVFSVERGHILEFLREHKELKALVLQLERENPHSGTRCAFLRGNGECSIYQVRPIVCRSHGAPIFARGKAETEVKVVDVCPLNFTDKPDLSSLEGEDFINLDLLNSLLALIDQKFGGQGARYLLSPTGILGES